MPPTSANTFLPTNRIRSQGQLGQSQLNQIPRFRLSSESILNADATGVYSAEGLRSLVDIEWRREAWNDLIDGKLQKWLLYPDELSDLDFDSPAPTIIKIAIAFAEVFRDEGRVPPSSVVPDPDGGIVFSLKNERGKEVIHFWDDNSVEYIKFEGSHIAHREVLFED